MLRVIAGSARSLKLKTPPGLETRPTTDRIRETLFNMLQYDVPGAVFLDLFCGSGAIGIEALSRGAKKGYFVDSSPQAVSCTRENIIFTKFDTQSVVLRQDCLTALHQISEKQVDLVFMDPPYGLGYERKALEILKEKAYITDTTLIVAETSLDTELSCAGSGFEVIKEKKYKTNKHLFIKRSET